MVFRIAGILLFAYCVTEGWTVFIERKIMGRLYGQAMYDTEAILGYKARSTLCVTLTERVGFVGISGAVWKLPHVHCTDSTVCHCCACAYSES